MVTNLDVVKRFLKLCLNVLLVRLSEFFGLYKLTLGERETKTINDELFIQPLEGGWPKSLHG